jgi:hypothetical protein
MRSRSALLALFAVLLHAAAPLFASQARSAPAGHIELCTAQGTITVQAGGGDAPPANPAAPDHCSICAFHHCVAAAMFSAPAPQAPVYGAVSAPQRAVPPVVPLVSARPRAPPQHS